MEVAWPLFLFCMVGEARAGFIRGKTAIYPVNLVNPVKILIGLHPIPRDYSSLTSAPPFWYNDTSFTSLN
ncbi:MAG: hypothetical protein KAT56_04165 [Sedimentisphaerales bacterium]|nr:hypothetical protein [Sedimentisphaerales bacterium]